MPSGKVKFRKSRVNSNKRIKLDDDAQNPEPSEFNSGFMTLSDDVLLLIFSYLNPEDLLSLSLCCRRFEDVTKDRTLWEHVDFRPKIVPLLSLKKFLKFFQSSTKSIATCGPACNETKLVNPSLSRSFLRGVAKNAPNLHTLILEDHVIDSTKLPLEDFPTSLRHLGIRNCVFNNIASDKSYFYKIDKSLPHLKVLDLSNNSWFVPHSLLALSKSQTLEELNLTGCDVSDCLPYTSLAANFGFTNLKVLDLRKTFVSDIEVSCFNRTKTLRQLYLEAPTSLPALAERGVGPGEPGGLADREPPEVTDCSITTFGGGPTRGDEQGNMTVSNSVIIIEIGSYPRPACRLQRLILKGYPGITDVTLKHVASYLADLDFLDVTRTGVTPAGILHFKRTRPRVRILHSDDDEDL